MSNNQSQQLFIQTRLRHYSKLKEVKNLTEAGQKAVYNYQSAAIKEAILQRRASSAPLFHQEYSPDFTQYQYDLELYIFLNYEALYKREIEIGSKERVALIEEKGKEYGATMFKREEHLQNAIRIRWPEKILPTGEAITSYALTPWAEDYIYGISNYSNVVTFGGGGQGKTYSAIALMVMIYDYFIYTKSGAQCSASTVSETKLKSSIWSHLVKLYSYKNPYKISATANLATIAPEYTFRRKNTKGKYIEEGGTIKGILLVQGAKTARQIDKLTGQHDVEARVYLLDEAQSTGPAPLQAYNNMFLHPKYGWFLMAGNFETDGDLLELNTRPDVGWENVTEETHMWESTLKSPDSDLGHKSLVIHYNNDLSPAIVGERAYEMEKKYGKFLPTLAKKRKLYKTKEDEETYEAKRFWKGFRFEKREEDIEKVLTPDLVKEFGAWSKQDFKTIVTVASVDTAHSTERDRSIITTFNIGLNDMGYPMIAPAKIYSIPKPKTQLQYYKDTSKMMVDHLQDENVQSGHGILDWTQRTQLLEGCKELGFVFHHIIYQMQPPKGDVNPVTRSVEKPVEIETVPTFVGRFEKEVKVFAHEKIINRITLGAYAMRLFLESGRLRNINSDLIDPVQGSKKFEMEMCLRWFENASQYKQQMIRLNAKEDLKKKYKFSPDILDTFFQVFYMLYVIFDIRPNKPGLGALVINNSKKKIDIKPDYARLRFRPNAPKESLSLRIKKLNSRF